MRLDFLDDDDEPLCTTCRTNLGFRGAGNPSARPIGERQVARPPQRKSLSVYLTKLPRLGGYLAHAGDSPPGNRVIWRGLARLTDIELGFTMGAELEGN